MRRAYCNFDMLRTALIVKYANTPTQLAATNHQAKLAAASEMPQPVNSAT
jgi:hypothetical protein